MAVGRDFERYAATAAIVLLVIGCYLVLRPFLTAFLWGGIIAVSTRPIYARLVVWLGGRSGLAAALHGIGLATVLLVPMTILGLQLTNKVPELSEPVIAYFAKGIPQPPPWVLKLPLVGTEVNEYWVAVAADPQRITQDLRPLFKPVREFALAFTAGLGSGILQFALALLMASLLHAWGDEVRGFFEKLMLRLGGESARRQGAVVADTVRGVFNGVIGTAAAQSLAAMLGYWIAGVPAVVPLGVGTFLLSVVPAGPTLLWLPAAAWLLLEGSHGWAIFMVAWGMFVISGIDNIVRPLLIGKGVSAPLGLIFLGVIGGILAFGFLGLFIGPTVLAVAFNLVQDWMATQAATQAETETITRTEPAAEDPAPPAAAS